MRYAATLALCVCLLFTGTQWEKWQRDHRPLDLTWSFGKTSHCLDRGFVIRIPDGGTGFPPDNPFVETAYGQWVIDNGWRCDT